MKNFTPVLNYYKYLHLKTIIIIIIFLCEILWFFKKKKSSLTYEIYNLFYFSSQTEI